MADLILAGNTSGAITISAPAVAGSNTLTLPVASDTLVGLAATQTLSNKTFSTTLGVGGATPSTSGSGISFPATQSASSDANTLDDYEEGTWTPTYTSGSGSGLVVTTNYAAYTKIGRAVTLNMKFTVTTVGSASSVISISGLPFSATTDGSAMIFKELAYTGTVFCASFTSTTALQMARYDAATPITANYSYQGCMTYFI